MKKIIQLDLRRLILTQLALAIKDFSTIRTEDKFCSTYVSVTRGMRIIDS